MKRSRPKHWPRWSRTWGPAWAGWWHMPRAMRRDIAADPKRALAVELAAGYRLPGESHGRPRMLYGIGGGLIAVVDDP